MKETVNVDNSNIKDAARVHSESCSESHENEYILSDNRYKLFIFDFDGTLLNTLSDLMISTNYALSSFGFPERTLEEVRCFVGNGKKKLIERAVPKGTDALTTGRVLSAFTEHYRVHNADNVYAYPGLYESLKLLKKRKIMTGVLSNKDDFALRLLVDRFFNGLFDYVQGEKEGLRIKPDPDGINRIINKSGVERDKVLYIGDSDVDFCTALNAGVDYKIVTWGFRTKEENLKAGVKAFIEDPEEIGKI